MGSLSYDGSDDSGDYDEDGDDDDGDDYGGDDDGGVGDDIGGGDDGGGGCNDDIDDDITDSPRQPDIVSLDSTTEGGELIYLSLW